VRTSIRKLPTFVCHVVDKRLAISLFSLLASSPDAAVATSYSVGIGQCGWPRQNSRGCPVGGPQMPSVVSGP